LRMRRSNLAAHSMNVVPPPTKAESGSLEQKFFVKVNDGYAVEQDGAISILLVTTDGALMWHRSVLTPGLVYGPFTATSTSTYFVTMRCRGKNQSQTCTNFRLARSPLNESRWILISMPNSTSDLDGLVGPVSAYASNVWNSEQLPKRALLAVSDDSGTTFTAIATPKLASVSGCYITPTSAVNLRAQCPTGMMVSFLYSISGGRSWKLIDVGQFS
jgi:hypothetical protein